MPELFHTKFIKEWLIPAFLIALSSLAQAQDWPKTLHLKGKSAHLISTYKNLPKKLSDSLHVYHVGKALQDNFVEKGYLAFSIDSITYSKKHVVYWLDAGSIYSISEITWDSTLIASPTNLKNHLNKIANKESLASLDQEFLYHYKKAGYAKAQLKRMVQIEKNKLSVSYKNQENNIYYIDSIAFKNKALLRNKQLARITNIKANEKYNQEKIDKIPDAINNSGFMVFDSLTTNLSPGNKARIQIEATKNNVNQFSGYVGLTQDQASNKTLLTGNVLLALNNAFKVADELFINWSRTGALSQQLVSKINLPYLWGSPVGILAHVNLEKQDTSFNSNQYKFGVSFSLNSFSRINAYTHSHTSYGLGEQNKTLPNTTSTYYGLNYSYQGIPKIANPQKGYGFMVDIGFGNRKQAENPRSFIFNSKLLAEALFKLPYGSIYFALNSNITGNDSVNLSEISRYGGIANLRGFKERSVFAKSAHWLNTEYRMPFNTNSNFLVFYEFGTFTEPAMQDFVQTWRHSFGGGLNLNTKSGILSLIYGLGKMQNEALNLKNGLVHIGYSNRF